MVCIPSSLITELVLVISKPPYVFQLKRMRKMICHRRSSIHPITSLVIRPYHLLFTHLHKIKILMDVGGVTLKRLVIHSLDYATKGLRVRIPATSFGKTTPHTDVSVDPIYYRALHLFTSYNISQHN